MLHTCTCNHHLFSYGQAAQWRSSSDLLKDVLISSIESLAFGCIARRRSWRKSRTWRLQIVPSAPRRFGSRFNLKVTEENGVAPWPSICWVTAIFVSLMQLAPLEHRLAWATPSWYWKLNSYCWPMFIGSVKAQAWQYRSKHSWPFWVSPEKLPGLM